MRVFEIVYGIERQSAKHTWIDRQRRDSPEKERTAVGRSLGDNAARNVAARTRTVLHDHGLRQGTAQRRRDHAGRRVSRAARRKADGDPNGAVHELGRVGRSCGTRHHQCSAKERESTTGDVRRGHTDGCAVLPPRMFAIHPRIHLQNSLMVTQCLPISALSVSCSVRSYTSASSGSAEEPRSRAKIAGGSWPSIMEKLQ